MADIKIDIKDINLVYRKKDWKLDKPVPQKEYSEFRCKYMISADEVFLGKMK